MAMAEPLLLTVVRMRLEVRIHGIHCDGQALIAAVAVERQGGGQPVDPTRVVDLVWLPSVPFGQPSIPKRRRQCN